MPTYEYMCEKCGLAFEVFQSMSESALKTCPKAACRLKRWGKGRVHRQIGAGAGLIFKGSGFYTTDYRSENYQKAAKKESDSAKPAGEAKAASGETKPASGEAKKTAGKSEKKKSAS